jgi:hypothetical protein
MKLKIIYLLVILFLLSCSENPFEADSDKVVQEYNKWKNFGIKSYTIQQQLLGFLAGSVLMVKVTVKNNQITNVEDTTGAIKIGESLFSQYRTIEQLFQEAINIKNSKPSSYSFVYDGKYHYPRYFYIDPERTMIDDAYGYITQNLIPQN